MSGDADISLLAESPDTGQNYPKWTRAWKCCSRATLLVFSSSFSTEWRLSLLTRKFHFSSSGEPWLHPVFNASEGTETFIQIKAIVWVTSGKNLSINTQGNSFRGAKAWRYIFIRQRSWLFPGFLMDKVASCDNPIAGELVALHISS